MAAAPAAATRWRRGARGALAVLLLFFLPAIGADSEETPRGHLQPFGSWKDGVPIEERSDVPEPEEFYNEYCASDGGHGRPVVFRGAAKEMAAASRWATDEELLERYSKEKVSGVEYNLKETRAGGNVDNMNTMRAFLEAYNTSDIYMVSKVPKEMKKDVDLLPCLRCGGFLKFLDVNNMWFGRGGSKSVVHYDDQDNINCMIQGRKRFIFMHPSYKKKFEAHPNTKKNKFGWVDTDLDRKIPGYGAFMRLDVDQMDLIKHPGWREVDWSFVDLEPGDCVYIPYQWYHQVNAHPARSINVHIWYWRPAKFDAASCAEGPARSETPRLADCSWGYEPPRGHLGVEGKGGKKTTKCRARPAAAAAAAEKKRRKRSAAGSSGGGGGAEL